MSFYSQPGWTSGVFNGTRYRYLSIKPRSHKPVFLLIHGFPSGPLTFHKIISILTEQGYGVVAPEMLGYGRTDKPTDLEAYARKNMSHHLLGILNRERISKVILFGHDHGSALASSFAKFYPERSTALILAAVGYGPLFSQALDWRAVNATASPILGYENFSYWKFFVENPDAPKMIDEHPATLVSVMWAPPDVTITHFCSAEALEENLREDYNGPTAPWCTENYQKELVEYLTDSGSAGMLMWYKAAASSVNDAEQSLNPRLSIPYLYLGGKHDPASSPILFREQGDYCDDITVKLFDTGHWVMEEEPQAVADTVLSWMRTKGL